MIEIEVAGAGAGKTFGMAEKIVDKYDPDSHKDIFAITYTNSAAKNIEEEILNRLGALPDTIKVQTIHTFLLNEIIYPFSTCILDQPYTSSSTCSLEFRSKNGKPKPPQKRRSERAAIVKKLKENNCLHVDDVYSIARKIIDPTHTFHSNKDKRAKVKCIHNLLNASIEKIFLDEAQDLDKAALKAFKAIADHAVPIYMVGDPKQAIKYPEDFNEFLINCEDDPNVTRLPNKNTSRRVPQEILDLSNTFCPVDQQQTSESGRTGRLLYVTSLDDGYEDFINHHIECKNLVCIYSKSGDYSTRNTEAKPQLHPEVKELIISTNPKMDKDLLIGAIELTLADVIPKKPAQYITNSLITDLKLPDSPKTFAQIMETCSTYKSSLCSAEKYHINSIIRTKGLEADVCVLVITEGIYKVLTKEKLKAEDHHNKTWNMVYVALTRAKSDLVLAIDHNLFTEKRTVNDVIEGIERLGFNKLKLSEHGHEIIWSFHSRSVKSGFQGISIRNNNDGSTTTVYGEISPSAEKAIENAKTLAKTIGPKNT